MPLQLTGEDLGIGLVTSDADGARRFYAEVMEFVEEPLLDLGEGVKRHSFRAGRNRIELLEPSHAPARHPGGIYDAVGIRVMAVFVDDLDAVIDRIRASGRKVADARDLPGHLRITFAKDADGNMLELIGLPQPAGPELTSRIQVGLTVSDVEASRRFYGSTLGLPEQPTAPIPGGLTRFGFSAGRSTIKFWRKEPAPPVVTGRPEATVGLRSIRLEVAELDALVAELSGQGAPVVQPPSAGEDGREGERVACVGDPDGNWIQLVVG